MLSEQDTRHLVAFGNAIYKNIAITIFLSVCYGSFVDAYCSHIHG